MQQKFPMANDQIEEIKEILNVIKIEQENLSNQSQKNFNVIVKKLMKMQEYNEISDMTNQVFEMRLSNIEDFLFQIDKYIYNKKNKEDKQN